MFHVALGRPEFDPSSPVAGSYGGKDKEGKLDNSERGDVVGRQKGGRGREEQLDAAECVICLCEKPDVSGNGNASTTLDARSANRPCAPRTKYDVR